MHSQKQQISLKEMSTFYLQREFYLFSNNKYHQIEENLGIKNDIHLVNENNAITLYFEYKNFHNRSRAF